MNLHEAIADAGHILARAIASADGKRITATCLLFSGGNDSTLLLHLFRNRIDLAAHVNTGIGIPETLRFVRDTCSAWAVRLVEKSPPPGSTYEELVVANGFPGPAHHWKMYQRLKERALRQVRKDFVKNPRRERILFVAGRRRSESDRRAGIPDVERVGSTIWASPLANWSSENMADYREAHSLPQNIVSSLIHMSGECLCGAFAKKDEPKEIGFWFPRVAERIHCLEQRVADAGHPAERCRWGWGADRTGAKRSKSGPLCSSCTLTHGDHGHILPK